MSHWRTIKMGDFVALQRGHDLPERNRVKGTIPVYGSAGINGFHNVARAKGPGVVVGRSGASYGVAHYCPIDYWPHNTILYVTDFKGNDERFAYYFLDNFDFSSLNSGSAQPSLNRNFVYLANVHVPPLPTQQKIATILSAYDDLIENNLRRIKILEEMAQNLYREWFVKFRFPGHQHARFIDSPLGRIPDGWEVVRLDEALRFTSGNTINKSDRRGDTTPVYGANGIIGFTEKPAPFPGCIVLGKIGSCGSLNRSYVPCWVSNNAFAVQLSSVESAELAWCMLKDIEFKPYIGGAANPYMPINSFGQHEITLPPRDVQVRFEDSVGATSQLHRVLAAKNTTLRRTRDLLLPKLISGEVDVSELDITIPEANA